MKAEKDILTFSSGKTVNANRCILGLSLRNEDECYLFDGYDGGISLPEDDWQLPESRLTAEECVELADAMLQRWAAFREKYAGSQHRE